MGGMREKDRKRVCFFIKQGNADTFYDQVQQLHEFVKNEWVAQGNLAERFQRIRPKIIVILDNASYHKRLDKRSQITKDLPNIRLEFLPAYSPDLNLIELVWHSCKEYIGHRLFKSVEELETLLALVA